MWHNFFAAIALVLVIEGILPFISPDRWRNLMQNLAKQDNRILRFVGLGSMVVGLVLLYFVHGWMS